MAVKLTTQQGQWVCFGADRAFAYKIETGRVKSFASTPTGWNLTVEHEAPNDVNSKLREVVDIMTTERRSDHTEKIEHTRRLPQAFKQMLIGPQKTSFLVTQTCKNKRTIVGAVERSQIKNPTNEAIESRDCFPRSMWSPSVSRLVPRLCWEHWAVRLGMKKHQGSHPASGGESQAEHDDLEVEDQEAVKETVESDNEPAMLAFRDTVIRELKKRFGVRALPQAPPKIRFCVSWHGGKRHRTSQEKVRTW